MSRSTFKVLLYVKGNKAKGKGQEARDINLTLDNIKAQIIKHYQRTSDREAFVTAEMVRNAYQGIGSEYETLIKVFDKDCANFLKRVGKDRTIGTYKVMIRSRTVLFMMSERMVSLLLCLLRLHSAPNQPSSSSVKRRVTMLFFFICSICFSVNNLFV